MDESNSPYFVYALSDPRTDEVVYVGITNNAYQRFKQHISYRESNRKKNAWIQKLQDEGVMPAMKILETVDTLEQAKEREVYWIRRYAAQQAPLTNAYQLEKKPQVIKQRVEPAPKKIKQAPPVREEKPKKLPKRPKVGDTGPWRSARELAKKNPSLRDRLARILGDSWGVD